MTLKFKGAFAPLTGAIRAISVIAAALGNFLRTESGDTITTEAGVELLLDET